MNEIINKIHCLKIEFRLMHGIHPAFVYVGESEIDQIKKSMYSYVLAPHDKGGNPELCGMQLIPVYSINHLSVGTPTPSPNGIMKT